MNNIVFTKYRKSIRSFYFVYYNIQAAHYTYEYCVRVSQDVKTHTARASACARIIGGGHDHKNSTHKYLIYTRFPSPGNIVFPQKSRGQQEHNILYTGHYDDAATKAIYITQALPIILTFSPILLLFFIYFFVYTYII